MTMPKNLSLDQQVEWKKKQVLRVKQWSLNNPEKTAQNKRNYYEENKESVIAAAKEWRQNNLLAAKESVSKYQARHKDEILKRSRDYYSTNRESMLEYHRQYREKNSEIIKLRVRHSQQKNPLRLRIAKYVRRAREKTGVVTTTRVKELIVEQLGRCNYCYSELVDFHVDHIIPLALGGINDDSNIQLLCPKCNRKKGAKHPAIIKETT
jgi:5-methylcytosine-specific restriction endonuclease McrA